MMDPRQFEEVVARLRAAYRRMDAREQQVTVDRLWSLVPKVEAPEPEDGPRTTSAQMRCPACDAALTVTLSD